MPTVFCKTDPYRQDDAIMKNGSKIVTAIVGLFALSLILFLSWQRNNISALIHTLRHSEQDITEKIVEKREELTESLKKFIPDVPRDFTPEEESKIISGELDPESAVKQLFLPPDSAQAPEEIRSPESTESATAPSPQEPNDASSSAQTQKSSDEGKESPETVSVASKAISDAVAQLYVHKATYLAKLGRIEQSAIEEYKALPEKERTAAAKRKIVFAKVSEVAELEKICDAQVEELLRQLEKTLVEEKEDLSIIKKIQSAYEGEKSLKKAYYLNKLYG
jgi:hypothetical protein